ncbi:MAG: hypothetical protein DMG44_02185 [Acidobacteria bacterium]|nr:MAG: hypothetical protein DMG44_02185 [Acidobacteriota bacterium]
MKMFVNLYSPDNRSFEVAPTIDISCHGARVVTKKIWRPNQQLWVRSIRGNFYSHARVVHCQPYTDDSFVIGILRCRHQHQPIFWDSPQGWRSMSRSGPTFAPEPPQVV